MALTFLNIVDDLRGLRITPSRTNERYRLDVYSWLFSQAVGEMNLPIHCRTLNEFIEKFSEDFTREAKRIWEITNGTYRSILTKYPDFLNTKVEFPGMNHKFFFSCFCFTLLTLKNIFH